MGQSYNMHPDAGNNDGVRNNDGVGPEIVIVALSGQPWLTMK